jgi:putative endonuclease
MAESHALGKKGEDLAADHLKSKGFRILYRNWKWGKNEIDIIAENAGYIIFTEVKTRSEDPAEGFSKSVSPSKQSAIINAANGYLQKFRIDKESRFDIITIVRDGESFRIDHIEDAFYPTLR